MAIEETRLGIRNALRGDRLIVASDYSGGHKGSAHDAYSFLVTDDREWREWERRRISARKHAGAGRSMSFKDLHDSRRVALLPTFLDTAGSLHGLLLTAIIDRQVRTIGESSGDPESVPWRGRVLERARRVSHLAAFLIAGLSSPAQDVLWVSDRDEIADSEDRLHALTSMVGSASSAWLAHDLGHLRVGTTRGSPDDLGLRDLIAIPDLVAGTLNDLHRNANEAPASRALVPAPQMTPKVHRIAVWYADPTTALLKVCIRIGYRDHDPTRGLWTSLLTTVTD